jgi:hypothetical protein
MSELPECVDGLPNLCGSEQTVEAAIAAGRDQPVFLGRSAVDIAGIDSAFAVALHMHQPLIPAGGPDLRTAAIVSNLQWMLEHPDLGDNHNAPVFHWCYKRMGELIPQLLAEGSQPRIMLEYSGTLLHGLRRAGLDDVVDALRPLACDPGLRHAVEWLGCPWGHAVAPFHAGAGLPAARARLAAPLRRHLRPGGAGPGARLLPRRDGAAQPPRRRLRVREDPQRLRI